MDSSLSFKISVDGAAVAPAAAQIGREFQKAAATSTAALDDINSSIKNLNVQSGKPLGITSEVENLGTTASATGVQAQVLTSQVKDLITQVVAGKAPVETLVQQGAQVGQTMAAMGATFSPVTVGIGVLVAALGFATMAHRMGVAEAKAYNEALVLTGNVAGVTRGQLDLMAAGIGKVVGTQGQAAAALAQLAATGLVAGNNLQQFAQHAIETERVIGRSVSDTVTIFAELGKSPVQASLKLNETTNYLTASVYNQIKALDDQGRKAEAASVAQKAFSDAEDGRIKRLQANLGTIEKALQSGTDAWKRFWDGALGIGRQESVETALQKAQTNAQALQKQLEQRQSNGQATGDLQKRLDAANALVAMSKEGVKIAERAAQLQTDDAVKKRAELDLSVALEGSDTRREQLAKAIQNANSMADQAGASQADRSKLLANVYNQYKDVVGKGVEAQIEIVRQGEKAKEEIIIRSLNDVKAQRAMGNISEISEIEQTNQLTLQQFDVKRSALVQELALSKKGVDNSKEIATIEGQIADVDAQRLTAKLKGEGQLLAARQAFRRVGLDAHEEQIRQNKAEEAAAFDAAKARNDAATVITDQYVKAIDLANKETSFEATLLGQSQKLRDIAIGQRRVELETEKEINRIKAAGLTADEQEVLIAKARAAQISANTGVVAKAELDEQTQILNSFEQSAHTVWTTVTQGGQDIWSKIRNTAKTVFFDWLYQMAAKPILLNVGAQLVGGSGASGAASTTASLASGASGLSSLSSLGGGATGFMNGLSAWGEGGSVTGMMSNAGLYSGMELVGAAFPYIAAAVAIYSLLSSGGTKPSIEGGYSTAGDPGTNGKSYTNGYYGGAMDTSSKAVVDGLAKTYASTVSALGGKAANLTSSEFTGIDQNGHASAVDLSAFVNGKAVYNRAADLGTNKVGSSDAEIQAALDLSTKKALIEALKATDMGPLLNDYLSQVTTTGKSIDEITTTLADLTSLGDFSKTVKALPAGFSALQSASSAAALELVTVAGSMGNLQSALSGYYDLFYTDAEKSANTLKNTTTSFADIGVTMPALDSHTRDWYKSLIQTLGAQDLSVEANSKAYLTALQLAGAIDSLAPAATSATNAATDAAAALDAVAKANQSWQDKLDVLTGAKTQDQINLASDLAAATDASTKSLINQVYAEQARKAAIAASAAAIDSAAAAEKTRVQATIDAAQEVVNSTSSIFDLLKTTVADLYGQVDSTSSMSASAGRTFIDQALATANASGYLPDQAALSDAVSAATAGLATTQYKSQFEQDRDRLLLASELSQLQDKAGTQLSTAEQSLQVGKAQLDAIDQTATLLHDQIALAQGTNTAIQSLTDVASSIADLLKPQDKSTTSTTSPSSTALSAASGTTMGPVSSGSDSVPGSARGPIDYSGVDQAISKGDFSGNLTGAMYNVYVAASGVGATQADLAKKYDIPPADLQAWFAQAGVGVFEDGGMHLGGVRLVGEGGPELEFTGPARYWDASTSARMLSGIGSGAGDASSAFSAKIDELIANQKSLSTSWLLAMSDLRKIYKKWDDTGIPATRSTTPVVVP